MADTYTSLWNRLMLRAPALDPSLAQDIIRDSFNQLGERREWSWLMGHGAFLPPAFNPGTDTVSVTSNIPIVTDAQGKFEPRHVGLQIRIGGIGGITAYPTYTIIAYLSPTQVVMDSGWVGPTQTNAQYQIFQCYFPMPEDFQYWVSLVNTTNNYRLWTNLTEAELDLADPQRTQTGISYAAAFYDNTRNFSGVIGQTIQVVGSSDAAPIATTSTGYSYPVSSIYTIEILTGGPNGTATFKWRQDAFDYSPEINTVDSSTIFELNYGIEIYFPDGTYNAGDVYVFQVQSTKVSSVKRYEIWPRPINAQYVYPYLYRKTPAPLTDEEPQLPQTLENRGDVLLEMALNKTAEWPGSTTARNPYYDLRAAERHRQQAELLIYELEKKDDDIAIKDLSYKNLPYYPAPWLDGSWLQSHAIYPNP